MFKLYLFTPRTDKTALLITRQKFFPEFYIVNSCAIGILSTCFFTLTNVSDAAVQSSTCKIHVLAFKSPRWPANAYKVHTPNTKAMQGLGLNFTKAFTNNSASSFGRLQYYTNRLKLNGSTTKYGSH